MGRSTEVHTRGLEGELAGQRAGSQGLHQRQFIGGQDYLPASGGWRERKVTRPRLNPKSGAQAAHFNLMERAVVLIDPWIVSNLVIRFNILTDFLQLVAEVVGV